VKLGVGFVADVAGGAAGNIAVGDPVTLEGVLIGAGIGLGVGLAAGGLGRFGKFGTTVEGIQQRSQAFGEGVGARGGSRVASALGVEVRPTPPAAPRPAAPVQETKPTATETEPRQIPRQQQLQQQQTKLPTPPAEPVPSQPTAEAVPSQPTAEATASQPAAPGPTKAPAATAHAGPEGVEMSTPSNPVVERARLPRTSTPEPTAKPASQTTEPPSTRSAKESMAEEARQEMAELSNPDRPDVRSDLEAQADDVRRQLHPRPSESTTPAERLRAALEADGIPVPPGHEAHHMVASNGGGEAGDQARRYLELAGVHPDAAANGVPLPLHGEGLVGAPAADTAHMGLHTETYYEEVARRLRLGWRTAGPEGVRRQLANIRRALLRGDFPH
jgi:hypothetical protein